jgi:hypothetical protein
MDGLELFVIFGRFWRFIGWFFWESRIGGRGNCWMEKRDEGEGTIAAENAKIA